MASRPLRRSDLPQPADVSAQIKAGKLRCQSHCSDPRRTFLELHKRDGNKRANAPRLFEPLVRKTHRLCLRARNFRLVEESDYEKRRLRQIRKLDYGRRFHNRHTAVHANIRILHKLLPLRRQLSGGRHYRRRGQKSRKMSGVFNERTGRKPPPIRMRQMPGCGSVCAPNSETRPFRVTPAKAIKKNSVRPCNKTNALLHTKAVYINLIHPPQQPIGKFIGRKTPCIIPLYPPQQPPHNRTQTPVATAAFACFFFSPAKQISRISSPPYC